MAKALCLLGLARVVTEKFHKVSVPAEGIHQTDLELCSVLWILLPPGLRWIEVCPRLIPLRIHRVQANLPPNEIDTQVTKHVKWTRVLEVFRLAAMPSWIPEAEAETRDTQNISESPRSRGLNLLLSCEKAELIDSSLRSSEALLEVSIAVPQVDFERFSRACLSWPPAAVEVSDGGRTM